MSVPQPRISGGIDADGPYWEALDAGEFRLPRCVGCRRWTWPAHWRCGDCGSWDFDWTPLEAKGVVYSWTRSWYAFDRTKARAPDVPYVVILAEIEGAGGARVMGVLAGDDTGLRVGASVTGTVDPSSERSLGYPALRWTLVEGP